MYDTISIGSAVIDVYVHSKEFHLDERGDGVYLCEKYGEKVDVERFELEVGGGGANTAVSFARLGFRSGVVAELGVDTPALIIKERLHREVVSERLMIEERLEKTGGSVILIGPDGGRTVMVSRGAASMLDPRDIPTATLERARWVHLANIGGRQATLETIFEAINARKLSWNPGKSELLLLREHRLRPHTIPCGIFSVNSEEWGMITAVQNEIISTFPEVLITNGKQGGTLILDGEPHPYQADSLTAVDETGAGDAFISAYVAARLYDHPPEIALQWGGANAASVVGHIGAQPGLLKKSTIAK